LTCAQKHQIFSIPTTMCFDWHILAKCKNHRIFFGIYLWQVFYVNFLQGKWQIGSLFSCLCPIWPKQLPRYLLGSGQGASTHKGPVGQGSRGPVGGGTLLAPVPLAPSAPCIKRGSISILRGLASSGAWHQVADLLCLSNATSTASIWRPLAHALLPPRPLSASRR
jgi:hypothetical protein